MFFVDGAQDKDAPKMVSTRTNSSVRTRATPSLPRDILRVALHTHHRLSRLSISDKQTGCCLRRQNSIHRCGDPRCRLNAQHRAVRDLKIRHVVRENVFANLIKFPSRALRTDGLRRRAGIQYIHSRRSCSCHPRPCMPPRHPHRCGTPLRHIAAAV